MKKTKLKYDVHAWRISFHFCRFKLYYGKT